MEEQKNTSAATPETEVVVTEAAPVTEPVTAVAEAAPHRLNKTAVWYALAFVVVAMISAGLWFVLEKDGRVDTTVFAPLTNYLKSKEAVATVNGVKISRLDFDSTLRQLTANTTQRGMDVTDPAIQSDLRDQAVESLVNTEVLRQSAVAAGEAVLPEDVEARYEEIETSIGGAEALAARMSELLVTKEMLLRDIENDLLIQAYLDKSVDRSKVSVSEDEIKALYEQVAASGSELPPLEEIRDQVESQIRFNKEQTVVAEYVDKLRKDAAVETTTE